MISGDLLIKKVFDFFFELRPLRLNSPNTQELIAPNSFSKFDREHTISSLFQFWSKYSPSGRKSKSARKSVCPVEFRKTIPECLENSTSEDPIRKKIENFFVRSLLFSMGREKLPIPVYNSVDDCFPEMINYISYSRPSDPSFTVKKEINDSTCCTCRDNCRNCECILRQVLHI